MSLRALPQGLRRFALDSIAPEPWRNGGGWTRTLAHARDESGLLWRVSVADIEIGGLFSTFDGMDRTAVLLDGPGLTLTGAGAPIRFAEPGAVATFPGEAQLRSQPGQSPARLLNVMTRRGASMASVETCPEHCATPPPGSVVLLLAVDGRLDLTCEDGTLDLSLDPGKGLELGGRPAAVNGTGASLIGTGRWVTVSICS